MVLWYPSKCGLKIHATPFENGNTTIGTGNASNKGNRLLLAGGRLDVGGTFTLNANSILAVEIQPNGLPECANITGNATFAKDTLLRPAAVRDAAYGRFPVLISTGTTGIINNGLTLDVPKGQETRWSHEIIGKTLYLTHRAPRTLFLVR